MGQKFPKKVKVGGEEMPGFSRASDIAVKQTTWQPLPPEAYEKPRRRKEQPEPEIVFNLRGALDLFKSKVPSYKVNDIKLEGARIGSVFRSGEVKYLVLFKRDFYYHFSEHFPNVTVKGYGVICNLKLVHMSALEGFRLAAVFPEGRCYWIDGRKFLDFYEENHTDVPGLHDEIAVPLSLLTRLF